MLIEPDTEQTAESEPVRASSVGLVARRRQTRSNPEALAKAEEPGGLELLQLVLHDLQTPVAILDASMKLLAGDLASADSETLLTLRDAQRAAHRIQQYIDHLVTSERFGRGSLRVRRTRVDVAALLEELSEEYEQHASACGVRLELDVDPGLSLRADRTLLYRILQNLFENALRHTRIGGRLLVRAVRGSVVEIRVCNDGPEVPFADRERIFGKYVGAVNHRGTTGLGLYFCRLALEAHGGTISVEDDPEWPACFVMRLPIAAL